MLETIEIIMFYIMAYLEISTDALLNVPLDVIIHAAVDKL